MLQHLILGKHCTRKFHLGSYTEQIGEDSNLNQIFYDPEGAKYFQISSQMVFEVALLHDNNIITNNISISAASFESQATVYNENFREVGKEKLSHLTELGRSHSVVDNDSQFFVCPKELEFEYSQLKVPMDPTIPSLKTAFKRSRGTHQSMVNCTLMMKEDKLKLIFQHTISYVTSNRQERMTRTEG